MRAKVFETASGKGFSVKEGDTLTDKAMDITDDARYLETTLIQSLINMGAAAKLPDKVKK